MDDNWVQYHQTSPTGSLSIFPRQDRSIDKGIYIGWNHFTDIEQLDHWEIK
jgi:hypothetical protein